MRNFTHLPLVQQVKTADSQNPQLLRSGERTKLSSESLVHTFRRSVAVNTMVEAKVPVKIKNRTGFTLVNTQADLHLLFCVIRTLYNA